jgi:hypothetical protein
MNHPSDLSVGVPTQGTPAPGAEVEPDVEAVAVEAVAVEPAEAEAPAGPPPLTEREEQILAFEKQWWRHAGAKEQAIREQFDLSATRYYQLLNGLLDNPAALALEPVTVARLRRLRSTRARARSGTPRPR